MNIAGAKGPMYQLAEFFFLYAGFLNDTLFIRMSLICAQLFIGLWSCLGVPTWPYLTWPEMEAFPIDAVVWSSSCIIVAAIPLVRQFRAMGKQIKFSYGEYTEEADALWRDWSRRCGMSRADFKLLMDMADWQECDAGSSLVFCRDSVSLDESQGEGDMYGDAYYYVVGGMIDCKAEYNEGPRCFQARPGSFMDAFAMLQLLGQPTAGLVMQIGPLSARVCDESEWTMVSDELAEYQIVDDSTSINVLQSTPGALVLRWRREDFIKVLATPGFCRAHLSLLVTQSTLDSLFRAALPEGPRQRYDAISQARRRRNLATCLYAEVTRSRWQTFLQWWRAAHLSFGDIWRPGPEQRGRNCPRIGSDESIVGMAGGGATGGGGTPPGMNLARSDLSLISTGSPKSGGATPTTRRS